MSGKHHEYSPSRLERYELCPGAWTMERLAPPDEGSPASAEGTMLHEAVASRKVDGLTPEQQDLVGLCLKELLRFGADEWQHETAVSVVDDDFNELTAGTADALKLDGDRVIMYDWKFGRVPVTASEDNIQMAAYAVGAMQFTGAAECYACVFQPRINNTTDYTFRREDIPAIIVRIAAIRVATTDGVQLRPGAKQCRFCAAISQCPAQRQNAEALVKQRGHSLTNPAELAGMLAAWRQVKTWGAGLEHQARQLLLEGTPVPGWKLQSVRGRREVADAQKAYEIMRAAVPHEDFMRCVSVNVSKAETAYAQARKKADNDVTLKRAREELAELLGDALVRGSDSYRLTADNSERKDNDNED